MRWLALGLFLAAAACSGSHKQPVGPAPEYEDAPPPSWMKDAGPPAPAAPPVLDGGIS